MPLFTFQNLDISTFLIIKFLEISTFRQPLLSGVVWHYMWAMGKFPYPTSSDFNYYNAFSMASAVVFASPKHI
jgi:hypothetical protein